MIQSPFAQMAASTTEDGPKQGKKRWLWIGATSLGVLLLGLGAAFLIHQSQNPTQKLSTFPSNTYFSDHRALAGFTFKAVLRVEADLGWQEGVGRLMAFIPDGDSRPIAALVAVGQSTPVFTKGQLYEAVLRVGEGGLLHASDFKKQ